MRNKKIMILTIIFTCLLSVSAISAADNVTGDIVSTDDECDLIDSSEEYNVNMHIETVTFNTTFMEVHLKVADKYDEKINDAKVILDNISEANFIDGDSVYHFNIYTNGEHTFTLDDGFYKAPSTFFTINVLNTNNVSDTSSKTTNNTIKLVSKNITMYYDDITAEIIVKAVDSAGNHIRGLNILMNDKITPNYDEKNGYEFLIDYLPVGTHKMKISLDDEKYVADSIYIDVNILKSTPILTAKKWYSTTKQYVTLRAEIENKDQSGWIDEGTVTFKINGKSYTVKVNGGDAIKKIKINKAGTYTYTATFKNSNHYTKTVKQKVYVYSTSKKDRTFNIKGYKFTLTENQYSNLVKAKNTGKTLIYKAKTDKKIQQTIEKVSYSYKWKYIKTVNLVYAHEKCYYDSNYKYDTIKKHWISDGEYYQTCKLYKKVEVEKVSYKKVNSRVYAWVGYALNGQASQDKYWIEIMTDNGGVIKGKLHWDVKSSTLTGLKTAKPKDMKNFSMR